MAGITPKLSWPQQVWSLAGRLQRSGSRQPYAAAADAATSARSSARGADFEAAYRSAAAPIADPIM